MTKVHWFFDYVSPFSYLQWQNQLLRLKDAELELCPVLFAGLLKHWGHKGPAEIPGKRRYTYRHVTWLAGRLGVPFQMPVAHPFNPLPLLRLSIVRGNRPEVVQRLFDFVWREGHIPAESKAWAELLAELDTDEEELKHAGIKQSLFDNGNDALSKGVFGVPTSVVDDEVFWGVDGFDFLLDYLENPSVINTPAMHSADELPSGI